MVHTVLGPLCIKTILICKVFLCVCALTVMLLLYSEVRVEGLETRDYLDNLKNRERFTEQGDAITFESEVSVWKIDVFHCCFGSYLCLFVAK